MRSVSSGRDRGWPGRLGLLLTVVVALAAITPGADRAATAASLKPEQVQAGYRRVLSTLTSGDEERALEELYAFESGMLGELARPGQVKDFWRFKLRAIRGLVESQSFEVLVPIAVFHHDAYILYRERQRPILAAHSRTMARELAETYADRVETREAEVFAGWMLTSFGSFHQLSRSVSSSIAFYRRALELDPANRAAIIGIAVSYERRAEYARAIEALLEALRIDPLDAEARLRLALCMARQEGTDRAGSQTHLRWVIAESEAEPWVRSVAFQELARLYLDDGQGVEAERVIRQGLAELRGDQQLSIQLAAILDSRRRPGEALKVLRQIATGDWDQASPRQIYDRWPTEGLAEARETMRQIMLERLPLIADGLSSPVIAEEKDG